jgi:hypothetical protein
VSAVDKSFGGLWPSPVGAERALVSVSFTSGAPRVVGTPETRTNVAQLAVRRDPAIPLHRVERAPQPASRFIPSLVSHFTAEES